MKLETILHLSDKTMNRQIKSELNYILSHSHNKYTLLLIVVFELAIIITQEEDYAII